jgi:hypothetical protein
VRRNADQGTMTLSQRVVSTPMGVWQAGDLELVRLETRAFHQVHWFEDGQLVHAEIGPAYLGVTDLVRAKGEGWRVLRLTRLGEVEGLFEAASISLDEARARAHVEFTACANGADDLPIAPASRLALTRVAEFDKCAQ